MRSSAILALLIVISALAVIQVRQLNREAFIHLESQAIERDRLNAEYSRLLLERATWTQQHAVDYEARVRLQMQLPTAADIATIALPLAGAGS